MSAFNWQAEAKRAANHVNENAFEAHRGAMHWRFPSVYAVFGNDGYSSHPDDQRARQEVEKVRECLRSGDRGPIEELGFGTTDDGYSWAMLVRSDMEDAADLLHVYVWDAWGENPLQERITIGAVIDSPPPPESLN